MGILSGRERDNRSIYLSQTVALCYINKSAKRRGLLSIKNYFSGGRLAQWGGGAQSAGDGYRPRVH